MRKLKQHRRASASRLRPPDAPPSNAPITPTAVDLAQPSSSRQTQEAASVTSIAQQGQLQPPADKRKSAQQAQQAQQQSKMTQAQQAQHAPAVTQHGQQVMQPVPLLMQQPGFEAREKLAQHMPAVTQASPQNDRHVQPQVLNQLPQTLLEQVLSARREGRRQRPTADAAGLACFGKGVQDEQGRMTQSGPLQPGLLQEASPVIPMPMPVPELFEVRSRLNTHQTWPMSKLSDLGLSLLFGWGASANSQSIGRRVTSVAMAMRLLNFNEQQPGLSITTCVSYMFTISGERLSKASAERVSRFFCYGRVYMYLYLTGTSQ